MTRKLEAGGISLAWLPVMKVVKIELALVRRPRRAIRTDACCANSSASMMQPSGA